jgi:hypothetical protein
VDQTAACAFGVISQLNELHDHRLIGTNVQQTESGTVSMPGCRKPTSFTLPALPLPSGSRQRGMSLAPLSEPFEIQRA